MHENERPLILSDSRCIKERFERGVTRSLIILLILLMQVMMTMYFYAREKACLYDCT